MASRPRDSETLARRVRWRRNPTTRLGRQRCRSDSREGSVSEVKSIVVQSDYDIGGDLLWRLKHKWMSH
jgi:hypothetical protein